MSSDTFSENTGERTPFYQKAASLWREASIFLVPIAAVAAAHAPLRAIIPTAITSLTASWASHYAPKPEDVGSGSEATKLDAVKLAIGVGLVSFIVAQNQHAVGSYQQVKDDVAKEMTRRHKTNPARETEPFTVQGTDGRTYQIVPYKVTEATFDASGEMLTMPTDTFETKVARTSFLSDRRMVTVQDQGTVELPGLKP